MVIDVKEQLWLPNVKSMTCSKNIIGICKNQIWLVNQEYVSDHRYKRTIMAYKCRILKAVRITLHGHYTCVHIFQSFWHTYRQQNMSAKQGIHKC